MSTGGGRKCYFKLTLEFHRYGRNKGTGQSGGETQPSEEHEKKS